MLMSMGRGLCLWVILRTTAVMIVTTPVMAASAAIAAKI